MKQRSRRKPFGVMVGWVAVWQAAKKALSHSPYVTCFPSASAVRICYQRRTCRQSRCLKLQSLDDDGFSFLPVTFPIRLPSRVARHTGAMADTGTLMHVDSMDTQTRTHACNNLKKKWKNLNKQNPTYSYVSNTVMLPHSHVSEPATPYWREDMGGILFCYLRKALAVMYRTAHSLLLSHQHAASWERADG